MITLYMRDSNQVFSHSVEADERASVPDNAVVTPPALNPGKFYRWVKQSWVELDEYPTIPEPEPAPAIVPRSVTPRQFWSHLFIETGLTETVVKTSLQQSLQEPDLTLTMIELEKSTAFERDNSRLTQMASLFGYDTDEKIDDFFRAAVLL